MTTGKLHERAILCDLRVTAWTARKQDKDAARQAAQTHNADPRAVRLSKMLVDARDLQPMTQLAAQARDYHRTYTLPWTDKGPRILPHTRYQPHVQRLNAFEIQYNGLADDFTRIYSTLRDNAVQTLGDLFNYADYPDPHVIRDKFRFEMDVTPIPQEGDFRLDVSNGQARLMEEQLRETIQRAERRAVADLYTRIAQCVGHIIERLEDPERTFRDSLTRNAADLADLLPELNILGDAKISIMAQDLKRIGQCDPQHLREYKGARQDVCQQAQAILDRIS